MDNFYADCALGCIDCLASIERDEMSNQNNVEFLADQVQRGLMTADEANVQKILMNRYEIIFKIPRSVRTALNKAVKEGRLGHKKKDGKNKLPEVYYHPNFEYLANDVRNKYKISVLKNLASVLSLGEEKC